MTDGAPPDNPRERIPLAQVFFDNIFLLLVLGLAVPLLAAVLLRTSETLADYGVETILRLVPLSGVLVWTALACLGAGFLGTVIHRRRSPMTRVIGGGSRAT